MPPTITVLIDGVPHEVEVRKTVACDACIARSLKCASGCTHVMKKRPKWWPDDDRDKYAKRTNILAKL